MQLKKYFLLILLTCIGCAGLQLQSQEQSTDPVLYYSKYLAKRLMQHFQYDDPRLIFGFFLYEENSTNFMGENVVHFMDDWFSQSRSNNIKIFNRNRMREVFKEKKLQRSGRLFKEETIQEIGEYVGANLMLVGKIQKRGGNKVYLYAEILEIRTLLKINSAVTPTFSVGSRDLEQLELDNLYNLDLLMPVSFSSDISDSLTRHLFHGDLLLERGRYREALHEFELAIKSSGGAVSYLGKAVVLISEIRAFIADIQNSGEGLSPIKHQMIESYSAEINTCIKQVTDALDHGRISIGIREDMKFYIKKIMHVWKDVKKRLSDYYSF